MRRIEKRTNPAIFLLLMGFSISAIAEPKMLVCESSAEAEEERMRGLAADTRDKAENSKTASEREMYARFTKDRVANADACINAKYGGQTTFTFDTKGLSSAEFSNIEVQRKSCGGFSSDVLKGTIEATPTTITFKEGRSRAFNVDRKNLTGGYDTERDYTCVLSDIDTSENLL